MDSYVYSCAINEGNNEINDWLEDFKAHGGNVEVSNIIDNSVAGVYIRRFRIVFFESSQDLMAFKMRFMNEVTLYEPGRFMLR